MEQKEQTIQWHPAFVAGIQIELGDEAKYFSFEAEHQLEQNRWRSESDPDFGDKPIRSVRKSVAAESDQ